MIKNLCKFGCDMLRIVPTIILLNFLLNRAYPNDDLFVLMATLSLSCFVQITVLFGFILKILVDLEM